jgi:hypothetical protein
VSLLHWNRIRSRRSATLVACTSGLIAFGAAASIAGPGESSFASDTNALRASNGLPAYRVCSDLTSIARSWATQMASAGGLSHNGALSSQMPNWKGLGENVGEGPSEPTVQQALANSPAHRANMLSSAFTEAGYGTAVSADGTIYVDEVFRTPMSGSCGGSAATTVAPRVAAAPVHTQTYVAPVTQRASRDTTAVRTAPQTIAEKAAAPTEVHAPARTQTPAQLPAALVAVADHRGLAAVRLAAALQRPAQESDVVNAVFTFHNLLATAVR